MWQCTWHSAAEYYSLVSVFAFVCCKEFCLCECSEQKIFESCLLVVLLILFEQFKSALSSYIEEGSSKLSKH